MAQRILIAGNPRAGRKIITIALVVVVVLFAAALLALRKKMSPQSVPPLHPSILTVNTLVR